MGIVYKARDLKLHRSVALKFLAPELTRDESAKQRFIQEARAASALDHAAICTIHEIVETPDGQLFIVMAYYDGETLKKRIERGPLAIDEALDIAIQVSAALVAAHDSKIIHRDIKPANVMITSRGDVKVVDFGLAKLVGQVAITQAGMTLGTLNYMSPEQLRAEDVDERTDIWSTGAVLYEMITGRPPFTGEVVPAISHGILNTPPKPISSVVDVAHPLIMMGYGRYEELEADANGLRMSAAAGYDPAAAVVVFRRMQKEIPVHARPKARTPLGEATGAVVQALGDYFASHPPTGDRGARLEAMIQNNRRQLHGRRVYLGVENYRRKIGRSRLELEGEAHPL